ncbi:MAG TPA: sodium/proton-translocating pyrophosphatase, partial [Fimbriimonadaceae bacterium]|nr:sodium/proton-translocating pyrophosphatase [Fimbriimonadaceae bacterium]
MKLLLGATRRLVGRASPRALLVAVALLLGLFLPTGAFADEASVRLDFGNGGTWYLAVSLAFGVVAIIFAAVISQSVLQKSPGSEKMQRIGQAIKEGALAYLRRQVLTMVWFVLAIAIGLFVLYHNVWVSVAFVGGVTASYIAGYSGMLMAVNGNMRTANAALT